MFENNILQGNKDIHHTPSTSVPDFSVALYHSYIIHDQRPYS